MQDSQSDWWLLLNSGFSHEIFQGWAGKCDSAPSPYPISPRNRYYFLPLKIHYAWRLYNVISYLLMYCFNVSILYLMAFEYVCLY